MNMEINFVEIVFIYLQKHGHLCVTLPLRVSELPGKCHEPVSDQPILDLITENVQTSSLEVY